MVGFDFYAALQRAFFVLRGQSHTVPLAVATTRQPRKAVSLFAFVANRLQVSWPFYSAPDTVKCRGMAVLRRRHADVWRECRRRFGYLSSTSLLVQQICQSTLFPARA